MHGMIGLIKSRERVRKHGEVYTPEWMVKKMCDMLPEDAWDDIDRTFLEPTCGNGNFLVEILRRKLNLCKHASEAVRALESITGIDILPDNVSESRQRMASLTQKMWPDADMDAVWDVLNRNIICGDSLKIMRGWAEE